MVSLIEFELRHLRRFIRFVSSDYAFSSLFMFFKNSGSDIEVLSKVRQNLLTRKTSAKNNFDEKAIEK